MVDAFVTSPRRVAVQLRLHAGEVADVVVQPSIIAEMTDNELKKIDLAINAEIQIRSKRENDI